MSKFKVVTTSTTFGIINKEPLEKLLAAGCEVILNDIGRPYTEEELIEKAHDADAVIVGNDHITENIIKQLPNVKLYAKHGVGLDKIDVKTADEHGVYVTNVPGSNSNEVADLVMAFISNLARHVTMGNKEVRAGIWNKRRGISMYQKTIGIIGTGHVGRLVAKRANGYDMNVLGYDIFESDEAKNLGLEYVSLNKLLTESDFITLHLPSTPETIHMIDKDALGKMKKDVLLINTAREDLVNLADLNEALDNNEIGGYATDVYSTEPTAHQPFFDHENVILTPHIGATTFDANLNMGLGAVESVLAIKNGQKPPQKHIRNNAVF